MADSDSEDNSSGFTRRMLSDFPLHMSAHLGAIDAEYDRQERERLRSEFWSLTRHMERRSRGRAAIAAAETHIMEIDPAVQAQQQAHQRHLQHEHHQQQRWAQANNTRKPHEIVPPTTLVSALPATTYNDGEDKSPKSVTYLRAQQAALQYLGKKAADQATPVDLALLTQRIEPSTKEPTAKEALRLCYYMRSKGFDVYHHLDPKSQTMTLYIINQLSHVRSRKHDRAYWQQNFSTNRILHAIQGDRRTRRRNALPTIDDLLPYGAPPMGGPGDIHSTGGLDLPVRTAVNGGDDGDNDEDPAAPEDLRIARQTTLAQAQATLDFELQRPDSRPEVIQEWIERVGSIRLELEGLE